VLSVGDKSTGTYLSCGTMRFLVIGRGGHFANSIGVS